MQRRSFLSASLAWPFASAALAADWTRFRGPGGIATSEATGLPTEWSAQKNIVFRTELPGPGTSSPITLGNRIYLTCYTGYALDQRDPGDQEKLMRHVLCLDRQGGKIQWQKPFKPALPESKYGRGNSGWHGYASSTPATDGEMLFVFFGKSGVYGLDLEGNQKWHADVGSGTHGWGSANSLVLYKNLLFVNAAVESGTLFALDKTSGQEVWKVSVPRGSRNTPVLVTTTDGKQELVLSTPGRPEGKILAFDPESGKERWRCKGIPDGGYVCPSVVDHDGIVYAIGGRQNTALAVRAGGSGDVSESHLLWYEPRGSNVSSPVYHDGHLYWFHERRGAAYCLNAKNGETVFQERMDPRPGIMYSSAMVADRKIYGVSQENGTYVIAAKPEYELLAHNKFDDDDSRTNACPVVSNGQLLLRNDKYLYCIGKST